MRVKPLFFNIMAALLLMIAFFFPEQIIMLYGHTPFELTAIASKLTIMNYLCMILLLFMSVFTYRSSRALLYLIPISFSIIVYNNYAVSLYGDDFSFVQTTIASVLFALVCFFYLQPEVLKCITDPSYRWWTCKPRFLKRLPIKIFHAGQTIKSSTFDISETGLFVKEDESLHITGLKLGDKVKLHIALPQDGGEIVLEATVIRKARAKGTYPAGAGLRFNKIEKEIDKKLCDFVSGLSRFNIIQPD